MAIFIATIAAAQSLGALPKPLVHKPFQLSTNFSGVTRNMNGDQTGSDESQTSPYAFLYELDGLDHTTGVMTQTQLADQLGMTEGVIRGAGKAVAKAIPMDRLKVEGRGKLTALGVAVITACIKREDATLEAWVHGLMQAMKSPEFKSIKGETSTADDIDLGFLSDRAEQIKSDTSALALRADSELSVLLAKSNELDLRMATLNKVELEAAEDEAYQMELDKLTAALRGKMRAKRVFLESLENQGLTPEI